MKLFTSTKILLASLGLCVLGTGQVAAENYFIGPEVKGKANGEIITYRDLKFAVGYNAFTSWYAGMSAAIKDGDVIYFSANTIGSININNNDIRLIGANAWCDAWSGKRNTSAETNITGTWKITGKNVEFNGFHITGAGCVVNPDAGRGSTCMEGFKFIYNRVTATTLTLATNPAIVQVGTPWRPDENTNAAQVDPTAWSAIERLQNTTVAHNYFEGPEKDEAPAFVELCGAGQSTVITDNQFVKGGSSINLFNTQGEFEITHNTFKQVGAAKKNSTPVGGGDPKIGEFCIRLYYIGCSAATDQSCKGTIQHNVFDGCTGQSGYYSLIRMWQGGGGTNDKNYPPKNTTVNINYNTFKNKTSTHSSGYNYIFYGDNTRTTTADIDVRWNRYDNSEMCHGMVKPAWETKGQRYYAGSTEMFYHDTGSTHGSRVDFYGKQDSNGSVLFGRKTPTGGAGGLKGWTVGKYSVISKAMSTVVQSMDIDDSTGHVYTTNQCSDTNSRWTTIKNKFTGVTWSSDLQFMTRVYGSAKEDYMYMSYCGHGSNIAVTRYGGKVWVMTGCGSSTGNPKKIIMFPWKAGVAANANNNTCNDGSSLGAKYLNTSWNTWSGDHYYPSCDNDNRLMVVRTRTSAGDHFTVFDLDEAMANPSTVKPIGDVFVKAGDKAISGSSRAFLNSADKGFKTWSDQGFTINGDYVYSYEGNGKGGYSGTPTPTDGKATLIINVINWRTGEYVRRAAILKATVLDNMCTGNDSGEPESIKFHRDDTGHPCMIIGIVTGASGAREYNAFCYEQKQDAGQGDKWTIPAHTFTPAVSSMAFNYWSEPSAQAIAVNTSGGLIRGITATVVGEDGGNWKVEHATGVPFAAEHRFRVTFDPDKHKETYDKAWLRISTPNGTDQLIPLTGTYHGEVFSGIENLPVVDNSQEENTPAEYYDMQGRRLSEPTHGLNIVRYSNGKTEKIYVR